MVEYIYLLQEREFIKTKEKIYKLGKTKQENLKRIKNYPNGTKLIIQLESKNCDIDEKNLIIIFKESFKQRTDIGTEYFEGNPDVMRKIICDYINNDNLNVIDYNENTNKIDKPETEPETEINNDVKILFLNYLDDEIFGGTKLLIKIYIEDDKIIAKYIDYEINNRNYTSIHNYVLKDHYMVKEQKVYRDELYNNYKYFDVEYKDYYNNIIKNKVIENNKIYDLNDVRFIRRLDNYKYPIKLNYSDKIDFITKCRLRFLLSIPKQALIAILFS